VNSNRTVAKAPHVIAIHRSHAPRGSLSWTALRFGTLQRPKSGSHAEHGN